MKIQFTVESMTCAACSARVEKVASSVTGVRSATVNLLKGSLLIEADDPGIAAAVVDAVSSAGYPTYKKGNAKKISGKKDAALGRLVASGALLLVLMYFSMGHMLQLPLPGWYHTNAVVAALLQLTLTLPIVYLNRGYYSRGLKAFWNKAPNMDSLIAVGSLAALIYSIAALYIMAWDLGKGDLDSVTYYREHLYFESAAMILTLISLGKYLEARAKGKTGDAIRKLMDLSPKTAILLCDGIEKEVPIEDVKVGDLVVVRSGASIPVDGTVVEGRGAVDQSALTGESLPIEVAPGNCVAAATINTEGYLLIRADKVGEDTTLAQVIHMVEEAGGSKAPIARLADKVSGIFVPVVMTLALIAFLVWMLVGKGLEFSLSVGIAVLVISCPCALGLATPVAIMVGTGRGAGMGVLFKNAEALENLHSVDVVVLDKTGTLTVGKPRVTDVIPHQITQAQLLHIAASLEAKSEHPFAKAILSYAEAHTIPPCEEFQTLPGKGVSGIVDGKLCHGGNKRMMEELGIPVPELSNLQKEGRTPLYFAAGGCYIGAIVAADVLKEDSQTAVAAMKHLGLQVVMLTGDNEATAQAIAARAGIDQIIADVLPADKANAITKLQKEGKKVLMVGDGINDAPALISADVGIAIGAGTDIAIESADVVLMNSSLTSVSNAIQLSKATIRNIRQNLFWAFFYNVLGIPIAAGCLYPVLHLLLNPMIGAAAMSMSSVFVVTNALRLRFFRPKEFNIPAVKQEIQPIKEKVPMEMIIKVNGMMCPHCKARVEAVCKEMPGVTDAVVDLQQKQVTVSGQADRIALQNAIIAAGYEIAE